MSTTDWVDEERPDCGCIVWHTCGRENSTENGTVLAGTMSTTDDTRQRTVAEILGWRFVHTRDLSDGVPWGYWVNDRTGGMHGDDSISGGPEIDCDDLLDWLDRHDDVESVEMWSSLGRVAKVWHAHSSWPDEYEGDTLHAALEAACRAVAEASGG